MFEVMQSMTDDPVSSCGECGKPVERVFHPVAIHFKGSGFYATDYGKRNNAGDRKAAADKASTDGGAAGSDGSTSGSDGSTSGSDSSAAGSDSSTSAGGSDGAGAGSESARRGRSKHAAGRPEGSAAKAEAAGGSR